MFNKGIKVISDEMKSVIKHINENSKDRYLYKKLRKYFFIVVNFIAYILLIYFLYGANNYFQSILYLSIFFASFYFMFLDIREYGLKKIGIIILIVNLIELLIFGLDSSWKLLLSITLFNIGIYILTIILNNETTNKTKFNSFSYFVAGGYIFTGFCILAFNFFILSKYHKLPFTCENIQNGTERFVEYISKPIKVGRKEVVLFKNEILGTKDDIINFYQSDVNDILNETKDIKITKGNSEQKSGLIGEINLFLSTKLTQAIEDNNKINNKVCQVILDDVQKKFDNPAFILSIVLLLFFLLLPFIRLIFFVISLLGFLIFKLMYLLGLYRKKYTKQKVENID